MRHVPPHNYRTLRSCGLYAPNACEKRQRARAALGQAAELTEPAGSKQGSELADHDRCEVCGRKLVLVIKIPRPRTEKPSTWPCRPLILGSIPIERFRSEPRSGIIHIEVLGRAAGGTHNHSVATA